MTSDQLLVSVNDFLHASTPKAWIEEAIKPENLSILLCDHMVCELKAAQTAMLIIRKYAIDDASNQALLDWLKPYEDFTYRQHGDWKALATKNKLSKAMLPKANSEHGQLIIDKMVLLIKEELHHFFQVLEMMDHFNVTYQNTPSSRYARALLQHIRTHEPAILVDKLICGAYIEARSCERFAAIAPHVDPVLGQFYTSLLRSEARHFEDYLELAQIVSKHDDISQRVHYFGEIEANAIVSPDTDFKFHSGIPNINTTASEAAA